jgi:hypothetical protein
MEIIRAEEAHAIGVLETDTFFILPIGEDSTIE